MLVLSWVAIPEAHPSPRFNYCRGLMFAEVRLKSVFYKT